MPEPSGVVSTPPNPAPAEGLGPLDAATLRARTLSGISWQLAGSVAGQALTFGITAALARLLGPRDFGLMAMMLAWTGLLNHVAELGFRAAIVQRQDLTEAHRSSAFWLTLFTGCGLAALGVLFAPAVAAFYDASELVPLFRLLSLTFLLSPFYTVPAALLMRDLHFWRLTTIMLGATAVAGAVAIPLAATGWGAWSLVWQSIAGSACTIAGCWVAIRWRPHAVLEPAAVKDLLRVGGHLVWFNIFNYFARNGDSLLIGRYIGAQALGFYSRAYAVMMWPLVLVSGPLGSVLFPALSRIQHDRARLKSVYLRSISIIALVTCPMAAGLLVVAESFIVGVFGEQWRPAVLILQILSLPAFVQSIGTTVGWICLSTGRTDLLFRWGVISSVAVVASIALGVMLGSIVAVALCYGIVETLLEYPMFRFVGRLIGMSIGEVLAAVQRVVLASAAMALAVAAVGWLLPGTAGPWTRLAVQVPAGIALYWTAVRMLRVPAYDDVMRLLSAQMRGLRADAAL